MGSELDLICQHHSFQRPAHRNLFILQVADIVYIDNSIIFFKLHYLKKFKVILVHSKQKSKTR